MPRAVGGAGAGRWPAPAGLREHLARPSNVDCMIELVCAEMDPDATVNGRTLDDMLELKRESEQRRAKILAGVPVTFWPASIPRRVLGEIPGISWRTELRLGEDDHLTVVG